MAKIPPAHLPVRRASVRGRFYVSSWKGITRIQGWPKPRGKNLSPAQREAVEMFREASLACKLSDAKIQELARTMSKGTQFLPRDLLIKNFYGRLFHFFLTNGERLYPMVARNDISQLLDVLGFQPGTILFRGPEYWQGLPPGNDGQALVLQDGLPVWGAGGGGGGAAVLQVERATDTPTSSTWPRFLQWDHCPIDELGTWDPGTPDRLIIPDGAEWFRVSVGLQFTNDPNSTGYFCSATDPDDDRDYPGSLAYQFIKTGAGAFQNIAFTAQSGWSPAGLFPYVRIRVNRPTSYSSALLKHSWATLEVK